MSASSGRAVSALTVSQRAVGVRQKLQIRYIADGILGGNAQFQTGLPFGIVFRLQIGDAEGDIRFPIRAVGLLQLDKLRKGQREMAADRHPLFRQEQPMDLRTAPEGKLIPHHLSVRQKALSGAGDDFPCSLPG